ncbi:hypothetical protein PUN4_860029 [Paraburkholderia unamae]|nr:hypothetical protein PUN4_860029 [Paraburkholderia unamae]
MPVHGRGRRGMESSDRRRAHAGNGLPERVRALGRVDPREGRARTDHRPARRRRAARNDHHERKRRALSRGRAQRPQDRLLRRPARQPRARADVCARARRAQLLLLHGRLLARGHEGRRETRGVDRLVGRGARHGAEERRGERLRRRARHLARRRRLQDAATPPRRRRALRPGGARSAQVRGLARARGSRRTRLQGHQPHRFQTAAPGRPPLHVLVLGGDRFGAVPEDRSGRRFRRQGGRAHPQAPWRGRRSPAAHGVPRRRVPEGLAVANRLSRPYLAGFGGAQPRISGRMVGPRIRARPAISCVRRADMFQ